MKRRTFLQVAIGAVVSPALPTPKPHVGGVIKDRRTLISFGRNYGKSASRREHDKMVNFARNYGASETTISKRLHMDFKEVELRVISLKGTT